MTHWHNILFGGCVHRLIVNETLHFGGRLCFLLQAKEAPTLVDPLDRVFMPNDREQRALSLYTYIYTYIYIYNGLYTFKSNMNSSNLITPHYIFTWMPQFTHSSYRWSSFHTPSWYQSMSCVTSLPVIVVPSSRSSLNLHPQRFCFSGGKRC